MVAPLHVDFGRSPLTLAREYIYEGIERATKNVMHGRCTEGEYKFQAGIAYGLQQALTALENAEKDIAKER